MVKSKSYFDTSASQNFPCCWLISLEQRQQDSGPEPSAGNGIGLQFII